MVRRERGPRRGNDERSGGKPARGRPERGRPGKPAHGKPAHGKPTHGKPTQGKPSHGKPTHGKAPQGQDAQPRDRDAARRPPVQRATTPPPARRVFPTVTLAAPSPARAGEWLLTTRPGAELDLIEELYFNDEKSAPRPAGASLVAARARPKKHGQTVELAFARQGFLVAETTSASGSEIARAIATALHAASRVPVAWAFDIWVPDSDVANPLNAAATALEAETLREIATIAASWSVTRVPDARVAFSENGLYAQVCLLPDRRCAVGVGWARDAISLAPGGRLRVHVPSAAPSRAAMKLLEAFAWLDRAPEPGDLCVDLGAAPGGWTWVLLEKYRTRVLAVDPANLDKSVVGQRGLVHLRADAFKIEPEETMDWLFCDMAFRPLEVAGLLAKWARRQWARMLIANIKLPMRKKAEIMARVRDILEDGGWTNLRVRQLYHDRDECTIAGVRL